MRRLLPLLLLLVAACGAPPAPAAPAGDGAARAGGVPAAGSAVEAGYRERLRLGLGGPFRLAELALVDPRLEAAHRRRVAARLLAATEAGSWYQADPVVLVPAGGDPLEGWRHLELITRAVAEAGDPRGGELAVRLAYRLAVLEGSVGAPVADAAVQVASLIRDRELARRDARRLRRAAHAQGADAVDLLAAWRRARALESEAPALQALPAGVEIGAIEAVAPLAAALRTLRMRAPELAPVLAVPERERRELARLEAAGTGAEPLPHATLVAALRQTAEAIGWMPESTAERWAHWSERATDEERFAAGYAALLDADPALRPLAAATALRAAVGLRAYAQERPWSPADPPVDTAALRASHGVIVRVADDVPAHWAAPTLAAMDAALGELRELLPAISLLGLRVEVTRASSINGALASHRPRERVLEWPVATGAGTLAHEIAHDLDWQSARRADIRSWGYASSRAAAAGRRGSFAAALATLTPRAETDAGTAHATRPPEVLARGFEWFVLTQMAARGSWNGVLSSAQDEVLTGHGSLVPPAVDAAYGPAVIEALRPLVAIDAEQRRAWLARHGPDRWVRASLVLRGMEERLESARARGGGWSGAAAPLARLDAVRGARDEVLGELAPLLCPAALTWVDPRLAAGYRELVASAAAAEARRVALRIAGGVAGDAGRAWMRRELLGPLWPAAEIDPAAEPLLAEVAARAESLRAPAVALRTGGGECATAAPGATFLARSR